jgi:outer membrane protein assembly factor BamB
MMRLISFTVLSLYLVLALAATYPPAEIEMLFRKGLYKEQTVGDIPGAIKIYRSIIKSSQDGDFNTSPVRLRLALCYELTGESERALKLYRQLVNSNYIKENNFSFVMRRLAKMDSVVISRLLWRTRLEGDPAGSVLAYRNRTFIITQNHLLSAYNQLDGNKLWSLRGVASDRAALAASGDYLYTGSVKSELLKINLKTGWIVWRTKFKNTINIVTDMPGARICVASENRISVLDKRNGRTIWEKQSSSPAWILTEPVVWKNVIVAWMPDGRIEGMNMATGRNLWEFTLTSKSGEMALCRNVLLLGSPGGITALDVEKGILKWNQPYEIPASICAGPDVFYILKKDGTLAVFNRDNGTLVSVWTTNGEAMTVAGNRICLSHAGRIDIISAGNGNKLWQYYCGGEIIGTPRCSGNKIFLNASDGFAYALNTDYREGSISYISVSMQKGKTFYDAGQIRSAMQLFEKTVGDLEPGNPMAWQYLVNIYSKMGKYDKVKEALTKSIKYAPNGTVQHRGAIRKLAKSLRASWIYETHKRSGYLPWILSDASSFIFIDNRNRKVVRLDQKSGKNLWEYRYNDEIVPFVSRVFKGNLIGFKKGSVFSMDLDNSQIQWEKRFKGTVCQMDVDRKNIYIGTWEGSALCLDPRNGAVIWSVKCPVRAISPVNTRTGRLLLVSVEGVVLVLDKSSGSIKDQRNLKAKVVAPPLLVKGKLFLGLNDNTLMAMTVPGLKNIWSRNMGDQIASMVSDDRDYVYVSNSNGRIHSLLLEDGRIRWIYSGRGSIYNEMDFHKGRLYIDAYDAVLELDGETGKLADTYQAIGNVRAPIVGQDRLFFATDKGFIMAFGIK